MKDKELNDVCYKVIEFLLDNGFYYFPFSTARSLIIDIIMLILK